MSEYQYYEFRAVDRPLDEDDQADLRGISTRAEITSTSLTNTYHYGDFKGDPAALVGRYFDAFVYVANWGTHQFMLRIPKPFLDAETASEYSDGESLSIKAGKDHLILDFSSQDEGDEDWTEGEPWMPSLIGIRDELMRGDHRALYLGWLASARQLARDDEEEGRPEGDERVEPPVPPGLAKLSGALKSLAEFLRIDDALLRVAARGSGGRAPSGPSRAEMLRWIQGLPAAEKDGYLLRLIDDESDPLLAMELRRKFREATAPRGTRPAAEGRRTLQKLLEAADGLADEEERKAAKAKARRDRQEAQERSDYLDGLARREPATWREVDALIATKLPKSYDRAVELLVDLRDLAARSGRASEAEGKIQEIRLRNARKPSLIERFRKARLG